MQNWGEDEKSLSSMLDDRETDDISSEEADVFERKKKFEELLKRFKKHQKDKAHLKGNDLRYNVYLKKMNKLTRMEHGLDIAAYKDYVNNLKQFAHINKDFEVFARDDFVAGASNESLELISMDLSHIEGLAEAKVKYNQRKKDIPIMLVTL